MRPPFRKDLTGRRFGLLTGVGYIGKGAGGASVWSFVCDCGTTIEATSTSVLNAGRKSCGCANIRPNKTHGLSASSEYGSYANMIRRCKDTRNRMYPRYGGRGISVCERWLGESGFINFLSDMGIKPTPKHTLDRLDNNLGYFPENCAWKTKKEQAQNRSTTRLITVNGVTKNQTEWDAVKGTSLNIVGDRIRRGWDPESAVVTPVAQYTRDLTWNGETHSLHAWEDKMLLGHGTIAHRLRKGWSVEDAISKPSRKRVPIKRFSSAEPGEVIQPK